MKDQNVLARSIRFALVASLAALTALPVSAQNDDEAKSSDETLEAITVVGSRIRRTVDSESAQPVLVLSTQDIEKTGLTSIGDVLQNLASVGPSINTVFNNGGDGSTTVDLRNLGAGRTLVLVNGHRWVPGLNGAVDLNTIPTSIIERIEVLKDGASSIYGSDAISGVINIITKSSFDGAEANGFVGETSEGDGMRYSSDFTFGASSDRANVVISASFTKEEPIFAGDREISAVPAFGIPPGVNGSSTTPFGRYGVTGRPGTFTNIPGQNGAVGRPSAAGYKPFSFSTDAYNFAPDNYLVTPQERIGLFAQGRYALTDSIGFTAHMLFNQRQSEQLLAPMPVVLGSVGQGLARTIQIGANNAYNTFGAVVTRAQRRFIEGGPRLFGQDVDTMRFGGAFDGSFNLGERDFYWDAGYSFTENDQNDTTKGLYNVRRIQSALTSFDSDPGAGFAPVCGTPGPSAAAPLTGATLIAGCTPLNIFGAVGSITPAMLNYLRFTAKDKAGSETQNYFGNISTTLFETEAGPVGLAFGVESRREAGFFEPDAIIVAGETTGSASQPTGGSYSLDEFYAETNVPLLSGVQFAELLEVRLAGRYTDYSTFGDTTNFSAGFQWKPIGDLKIRGNYNEGFRAPTITDLFLGLSDSFPVVTDPCDVRATNPNRAANCVGAPAGFRLDNSQIASTIGGNVNATAETAETSTLGFVYSPSYVENLGISLDWWKIQIDNAIGGRTEQNLLDACYRRPVRDQSACARITRDSTSFLITNVLAITENVGTIDAEGVDLNVTYALPEFGYGNFDFLWDSTYYINSESDNLGFDPTQPTGPGNLPRLYTVGRVADRDADFRLKSNLSINWEMGDFGASWTSRYSSSVVENCSNATDNGFPELCSVAATFDADGNIATGGGPTADGILLTRNKLGAVTYHDVRAYYKGAWGGTIAVGVNNAFEKDPPVSYETFANSFLPTYDVPGRFYYLQYKQTF